MAQGELRVIKICTYYYILNTYSHTPGLSWLRGLLFL